MDSPGMVSVRKSMRSYYRLSAEDLPEIVDSLLDAGTDPVPPTRGRLATALRWTAYGLRQGRRFGIHSDVGG